MKKVKDYKIIETDDIVVLKNVVKRYKFSASGSFFALNKVNLTIKKGEFVAVVGTSGSGKSTLMHIIGGVDKPTSGDVTVCGANIYEMDDESLSAFRCRNIGMVFQFFNLIPVLNVEENIAFPIIAGGQAPDFDEIDKIIRKLGLGSRGTSLPNQLSGGQQQRVAIGRSIVTKPALLLADEPTGNLDSKNSKQVIDLLEKICREYGTALVIVTHDEKIAQRADRIIRIEDGRIISDTVNEVSI